MVVFTGVNEIFANVFSYECAVDEEHVDTANFFSEFEIGFFPFCKPETFYFHFLFTFDKYLNTSSVFYSCIQTVENEMKAIMDMGFRILASFSNRNN